MSLLLIKTKQWGSWHRGWRSRRGVREGRLAFLESRLYSLIACLFPWLVLLMSGDKRAVILRDMCSPSELMAMGSHLDRAIAEPAHGSSWDCVGHRVCWDLGPDLAGLWVAWA